MTRQLFLLLLGLLLGAASVQAQHISDFTSISQVRTGNDTFQIPSTHVFQYLVKAGDPLSAGGVKGINSDFTGFVPGPGNSSTQGWLNINSEFLDVYETAEEAFGPAAATALRALPLGSLIPALDNVNLQAEDGGDVTVLDLSFNSSDNQWEINASENVDFVDHFGVPGTGVNCSGAITPWGTSITCEEINYNSLVDQIDGVPGLGLLINPNDITDLNNDGWYDLGWCVEVDPITRDVVDYDGDGQADKLWQMGNMAHENKTTPLDSQRVYWGEDNGASNETNYLYKFVADTKGDLSSGDLFVLVRDSADVANGTGTWVQVPNKTKQEQNEVVTFATNAGAFNVPRVEDVEWNPHDSMIYNISTNLDQIIRYRDQGATISDYEVWVDNIDYTTDIGEQVVFSGPDNMAIDDRGNFWVLEDNSAGGYIYFIDSSHTPQNPQVKLFAISPAGSEPTGITFSPDYKYMFLSIQHPSTANSTVQSDAVGCATAHNGDVTLVIAMDGDLGGPSSSCKVNLTDDPANPTGRNNLQDLDFVSLYPNPVKDIANVTLDSKTMQDAEIKIYVNTGKEIYSQKAELTPGENTVGVDMSQYPAGLYFMTVGTEQGMMSFSVVKGQN